MEFMGINIQSGAQIHGTHMHVPKEIVEKGVEAVKKDIEKHGPEETFGRVIVTCLMFMGERDIALRKLKTAHMLLLLEPLIFGALVLLALAFFKFHGN